MRGQDLDEPPVRPALARRGVEPHEIFPVALLDRTDATIRFDRDAETHGPVKVSPLSIGRSQTAGKSGHVGVTFGNGLSPAVLPPAGGQSRTPPCALQWRKSLAFRLSRHYPEAQAIEEALKLDPSLVPPARACSKSVLAFLSLLMFAPIFLPDIINNRRDEGIS